MAVQINGVFTYSGKVGAAEWLPHNRFDLVVGIKCSRRRSVLTISLHPARMAAEPFIGGALDGITTASGL